jgi:hypothetical protein
MLRFSLIFITALSGLLTLAGCYPKQPDVTTHTSVTTTHSHTIVTVAPAPKELTAVPGGFSHCFTVEPGWYNDVWVHEHRICQYQNAEASKRVWVSNYWQCSNYTNDGTCNNWDWVKGHWADTIVSY